MAGGGAPTGQALAGVYGEADPQCQEALTVITAPRTASTLALDQGLYDYVLISGPQQSCKTGFMISPTFLMKRLRPRLPPLAPPYRVPPQKDQSWWPGKAPRGC